MKVGHHYGPEHILGPELQKAADMADISELFFSELVLILELFARKHQFYQHQLYHNRCNLLLRDAIGGNKKLNFSCY